MSQHDRAKLNAHSWEEAFRDIQFKEEGDSFEIRHVPKQEKPITNPVISEKQEFAQRQFGSVNLYINGLKSENERLRRRVQELETELAKERKK